ncbi:sensor histidine kinase [Microtetraspora malaysiensis]|uniref:sensor histidine kinase n=1 Tax=Microtetraspora malaysiensis TaxID=161358 RepID=UPI003D8E0510
MPDMRARAISTRSIAAVAVTLFAASMAVTFTVLVVMALVDGASTYTVPIAGALGALLTACYARVLWAAFLRQLTWRHQLDVAVIAMISYGVPLFAGTMWLSLPMAFISAASVAFPRRAATWAVTLAAIAVTPPLLLFIGIPLPVALVLGLVVLPIIAPTTYGAAWLCHIVADLREARAELARRAVDEERLRFARDLHDTLGHTLHAIALRAELGERLITANPAGVGAELAEIQRIARAAAQEVRQVARGHRATSLSTELDGVAAVLTAAGIRCEQPQLPADLPSHVHTCLGWVAREAVTNVLRHSTATWCEVDVHIEEENVVLQIVNDGGPSGAKVIRGNGLTGLAERVEGVGGTLAAESGGGRFRISASVPLAAVTA